jgi:hypothetical protein
MVEAPRVRATVVKVWKEPRRFAEEPTWMMSVRYAPGSTLEAAANRAVELAGEPQALVKRRVSFLAVHGEQVGFWIPHKLYLDVEPPLPTPSHRFPSGERVYVVGPRDLSEVKIGTTSGVHARMQDLRAAAFVPLYVHAHFDGSFELERRLHRRFADLCVGGERFRVAGQLAQLLDMVGLSEPIPLMEDGGPIGPEQNPPYLSRLLRDAQAATLGDRFPSSPLDDGPVPRMRREPRRSPERQPPHVVERPVVTDAEIDEVILSVVARLPGELTLVRPAHILWGSKGEATLRDRHDTLPEYGRFADESHERLRARTDALLASDDLGLVDDRLSVRVGREVGAPLIGRR